MRHRSPLMKVELSSLPAKADILAAKLVIVRANDKFLDCSWLFRFGPEDDNMRKHAV